MPLLERTPQYSLMTLQQEKYVRLPSVTPQETETQRDLREISVFQNQFDRVLGRRYDQKDTLQRSYNPVIDRWRIEKLRDQKDRLGEVAYTREIRTNLETNLKERMQVGDSVVKYRIEGDQMYSEHFPQEPFSKVLQRGAEYRLQHGTPEPEREGLDGERGGFEKIRAKMTDPETPRGTKMTSFSPKGRVEGSSYDRDIVDEYELIEDQMGRHVKLTRRMVDLAEADYYKEAIGLDPTFFDDYDGRSMDAWMLSHPVEGAIAGLAQRQTGISSEKFDEIFESETLQRVIDYYVDRIRDKKVDWQQVARSFNAVLNQADKEEKVVLGQTIQHQLEVG